MKFPVVPLTALTFCCLPSLLCWQLHLASACSHGDLRINGTSSNAGRLEICNSSQWLAIHDSQWDDHDAAVACSQLRFSRQGATAYRKSSYDPSVSQLSGYSPHLANFRCSGSEIRLTDCSHTFWSDYHNNDAGIKCLLREPCRPIQGSTSPSTYGATISWRAGSCSNTYHARPEQYYVSCKNEKLSASQTSTTISGLRPNKYHTCYVYAIDNLGRMSTGESFSFRTIATPLSFAPLNFRYDSIFNTSVRLRWDPPPPDYRSASISTYTITYRCCSSSSPMTRSNLNGRTIQLTGLQPGQRYRMTVAACPSSGSCGMTSELHVITLASVNSFAVRSTSPTTAKLTWNPPPSGLITHYLINITNIDTGERESVRHIPGYSSSATIDSLHPNHHYRFSIAAFTSGLGPYSSVETHQPQDGPQNVDCGVRNLTTLYVSWSEPLPLAQNGPIEQYWVFIRNKDEQIFVYNNSISSPSSIHVPSLTPYRNYICRVAAFAREGLGPFSSADAWLSNDAHTSEVFNLSSTDVSSTSIRIEWLRPYTMYQNTRIQYYNITVQDVDKKTTLYQTSSLFHYLTSLHPYHRYSITVVAVTNNTSGPNTTVYTQTLEDVPSASPRSLRVTKVSPFSVVLAWKAPPRNSQNGVIIGYTVEVFQTANDSTYYDTSKTTFTTVSDLDDDTTYTFTVAAKTAVGLGPYSTHVTAKTRNYALEVGSYTGASMLILLVVIGAAVCIPVLYCKRQRIKRCFKLQTKISTDESQDFNVRYKPSKRLDRQSDSKGHRESVAPQLPDRGYLEDIDFVSQEFDLFFTRTPELPARSPDMEECKEDDHSVEIDLEPRKDDLSLNTDSDKVCKDEISLITEPCKDEKSLGTEEGAPEASHYMSLKKPPEESVYMSLTKEKKQRPVYQNIAIKEKPAQSHYQQVSLELNQRDYQVPIATKTTTAEM